jgi:hypothetical protein
VSKVALFKKEKESARTMARCHVSLEKSSKNYTDHLQLVEQGTVCSVRNRQFSETQSLDFENYETFKRG